MQRLTASLCLILLVAMMSGFTHDRPNKPNKKKEKVSQLGEYQGYTGKTAKKFDRYSQYVPMKDSVRLAVDVFLPNTLKTGEKVPTIVYFVRYVRTLEPKGFFKLFGEALFGHVKQKEIDFFTSHGYACMIVDLRGSGASFGHRKMEFSPQEVDDMGTVLDWAVAQSWSDGQTATTGVSYTGTTAELALSTQHPSLKACIPRCNIFDLYADMCFPGGLRQAPFVDVWKKTTQALDFNRLHEISKLAKLAVKGASPVDGDKKRVLLKAALKEHDQNFDIFSGLYRIECRDDVDSILGMPIDQFSIHNRIKDIEASKVPMYRISGWYDGACVSSTIKGYLSTSNSQKLLVGPWDHGPHEQISPFEKSNKYDFDMYSEMLRFLDFHMRGIANGIDKEPKVHYYQMGTETFKSSDVWPPAESVLHPFYLSNAAKLTDNKGSIQNGKSDYVCDYTVGTGGQARWNSLTPLYRHGDTEYNGRAAMNKKMLVFDGEPAKENMEITGHALVDLYFSADATDVQLLAYIEDLAPDGTVAYITEGHLRASHRKESNEQRPYNWFGAYHTFNRTDMQPLTPNKVERARFDMIPTSYLLQAGHRLRVSIAVADVDHFDLGTIRPKNIAVYHSAEHPSMVEVPMMPAAKTVSKK